MARRPTGLALALCAPLLHACGGGADSDPDTGEQRDAVTAPSAGASSPPPPPAAAGAEEACTNAGEVNLECPMLVGPFSGACATHGACCHRASNAAVEATLAPDEAGTLEYRLVYSTAINHPQTLGTPLVQTSTLGQVDAEQTHTLWSFSGPRTNGESVSGDGSVRIGTGRYECDGTYSYYGEGAAPPTASSSDPARWSAPPIPARVDAEQDGPERQRVAFEDNRNRELSYVPYVVAGTGELDWELVTQGFDILSIDTGDSGRDCIGVRDGDGWIAGGQFLVYVPLSPNSVDTIDAAMQSFCQLLSFGILPDGEKDVDCTATPRCTPGEEACPWLKLPDSLCPQTPAERALWGCHLGAEGNPNTEVGYPTMLGCTAQAPTTLSDPERGDSPGQCCDPLGASSELPPCNAFRLVNEYVAAAVEIRDEPAEALQALCE